MDLLKKLHYHFSVMGDTLQANRFPEGVTNYETSYSDLRIICRRSRRRRRIRFAQDHTAASESPIGHFGSASAVLRPWNAVPCGR
jgi:hypothetical protein